MVHLLREFVAVHRFERAQRKILHSAQNDTWEVVILNPSALLRINSLRI
jgi:hypothetical protein